MNKSEELNNFLLRTDELMNSKYIVADIKIVHLLKTIAGSETLLALFKSCLDSSDYEKLKKKYFVQSKFSSDKGEFICPENSGELIALVFGILVDIDSKRLDLALLLDKYFYVNGSFFESYNAFLEQMIKPFSLAVKAVMEKVIDGSVQDPVDAVVQEEKRKKQQIEEEKNRQLKEKELSLKSYGDSIKALKDILLSDKTKIKESKLKDTEKADMTLITDTFANVIESEDKDAIAYAFASYKFMVKSHPFMFFGKIKKAEKLVKVISDEI